MTIDFTAVLEGQWIPRDTYLIAITLEGLEDRLHTKDCVIIRLLIHTVCEYELSSVFAIFVQQWGTQLCSNPSVGLLCI